MTHASEEGTPRRAFSLGKMPRRSRGRRGAGRELRSGDGAVAFHLGRRERLPKPAPRRHSEYVQGALNVNVCTLEMSRPQRNVIPGPLGLEGPLCLRFWGSDMGPVALLLETLESSLCAECGEPKAKPALVLAAGRVGSAPGREPLHLHSAVTPVPSRTGSNRPQSNRNQWDGSRGQTLPKTSA